MTYKVYTYLFITLSQVYFHESDLFKESVTNLYSYVFSLFALTSFMQILSKHIISISKIFLMLFLF